MQPRPRGPEPGLERGSPGSGYRRGASSASLAGRQGSPARTRRDPRRPPERARSPARWPKLSEPPGPAWLCAHILSRKLDPRRRFSKPPGAGAGDALPSKLCRAQAHGPPRFKERKQDRGKSLLISQERADIGLETAALAGRRHEPECLHQPAIWLESSVVICTSRLRACKIVG